MIVNCCLTPLWCVQVLFCYEQFDELTLLHLRDFDKKKVISVETDIVVDHYKEEKFEDVKPGPPPPRLSCLQNSCLSHGCSPDSCLFSLLQPLSA